MAINVSSRHELDAFKKALEEYQIVSGKSPGETIERQGTKLRFEIYKRLRREAPAKGEITREAINRGYRVRISKAVRKRVAKPKTSRGLNYQAKLVKAELAARERSRMYMAISWVFKGMRPSGQPRADKFTAQNRLGKVIGRAEINTRTENAFVRFRNDLEAMDSILRERNILTPAVRAVRRDMQVYLDRKAQKDVRKMVQFTKRLI